MANNNNDQEVDQATDSNYNNATAKASSSSPKKSPGIAFGFAGKKNLVSSAVSSVTKLARKISQKTRATVVIAAPTAVSSTTTAPSTKTTTKTATKNTSATSLSPIDEESIDATLIDPHSLKNAEFSGSLFIRMGNEKMWKKRWCALDEGTLYILKDEEVTKKKSVSSSSHSNKYTPPLSLSGVEIYRCYPSCS